MFRATGLLSADATIPAGLDATGQVGGPASSLHPCGRPQGATTWAGLVHPSTAAAPSADDGEDMVFAEDTLEAVLAALLEAEVGVGLGVLLQRR